MKEEMDKLITVQAARKAINEEKQQRALICSKEISAILNKYNCQLVAVPMISEGKIVANCQIIAKE